MSKKKVRQKGRLLQGLELWLRVDRRRRAVYWLLLPVLSLPALWLAGSMDEGNARMPLFWAALLSFFTGVVCQRFHGGAWDAALSGAWLPALMAWRKTYWALGWPSPAGAAQELVGLLGWYYPAPFAALAAVLCAMGLAGYVAALLDLRINGRYDAWAVAFREKP